MSSATVMSLHNEMPWRTSRSRASASDSSTTSKATIQTPGSPGRNGVRAGAAGTPSNAMSSRAPTGFEVACSIAISPVEPSGRCR